MVPRAIFVTSGWTAAGLLIACFAAGPAGADDALEFKHITVLPGGDVIKEIRGGVEVKRSSWPATFFTAYGDRRGCTAQLVGQRTVLLAAHCLCTTLDQRPPCNPKLNIVLYVSGDRIPGSCEMHPEYRGGTDRTDLALCLLERSPGIRPYETVNTDPQLQREETPVRLMGFGCTDEGSNDDLHAKLYAGNATLGPEIADYPGYLNTVSDIAICEGDSGGAVYAGRAGLVAIEVRRTIIAVNSHLVEQSNPRLILSLLASTAGEKDFFTDWSIRKGQAICGISTQTDCRQP